MKRETTTIPFGRRELTLETGRMARQAGGSVVASIDDTIVMATACSSAEPKQDVDFLPLRVDYQEKFSSVGKTLGGYIKREGRPSERETLLSRLIDRPIRPLFPKGYFYDTQLLAYVLSYDGIHVPDCIALCAVSAALAVSDIPFPKPIGAVRVGLIDGEFVINPTANEILDSSLDLVLAGTHDAILMTEGYCNFLTEEQLLEAVERGHKAIIEICDSISNWAKKVGKPKFEAALRLPPAEAFEAVEKLAGPKLKALPPIAGKDEREALVSAIKKDVLSKLCPDEGEPSFQKSEVSQAFKKVQADIMRQAVLETGRRCDGRKVDEVRPITIEPHLLPKTHGSALFTRGETQALAVCTLGGESMAQRYEALEGAGARRFYLQYSFPPFSVGEVGRMGPPGRREVGHGKLAERSLSPILPAQELFPYVIRLESNILESNGSSSMASVCGGCLALMEAGVPVKRPVSGIAMGLILQGGQATVLSDILGVEDALGDMDFKVAGDVNGITAFQMDIKVEGITHDIMSQALKQAREGRIFILNKMLEVIPSPRAEIPPHAPRIEMIRVAPSKIGAIIGPGGKQIRAIVEETGVEVDINDDGVVSLSATDAESLERAKAIIHGLTADIEVGATYTGTVKSVVPFGVFVEVLPGKEGLCHISELHDERIRDINAFIKEGERVTVKVLDINERGQVRLSRKAAKSGDSKKADASA